MEKANGLDQFYSRMTAGGKIELFVDKYGRPTISYPHVHIVHNGSKSVDVVASKAAGQHVWRTTLRNPDGNEVNRAVRTAQSKL